jgi:hypothetical protein
MARTFPFSVAQAALEELVAAMVLGDELVLTANVEPVAVVTRAPSTSRPSQRGTAKDRSFWMSSDFDTPLEDFDL